MQRYPVKTNHIVLILILLSVLGGCRQDDDASFDDNEAPSISSQTFAVLSDIDDETIIGILTATDPDADELSFSIIEDPDELFTITDDGELSLRQDKNFGAETSYAITVEVSDGELTASAIITIEVITVNESPEISNQVFNVTEGVNLETTIGTITASDPEGDELTFSILVDTDNLFVLSEDGKLSLHDGKQLDFETSSSHEITVGVSDGEVLVSATVTINVIDIDEELLFITKWEVEDNESVVLPLYTSTAETATAYDFVVDWGDGTVAEVTGFDDPDASHMYTSAGVYSVSINGELTGFNFSEKEDSRTLFIDVVQWGNIQLGNDGYVFKDCISLEGFSATDAPDLSKVTNMEGFFYNASYFNGEIGHWDVSKVTNMSFMFSTIVISFQHSFNQDISAWDVSNVTNMVDMFAISHFNQDISNWDVSNVTNMIGMFFYSDFNQDIGSWEVDNVTYMAEMFFSSRFNYDISEWNVSKVEDMTGMFYRANDFDQDLSNWDTSGVIACDNFIDANSSLMTEDKLPTAGDCF